MPSTRIEAPQSAVHTVLGTGLASILRKQSESGALWPSSLLFRNSEGTTFWQKVRTTFTVGWAVTG